MKEEAFEQWLIQDGVKARNYVSRIKTIEGHYGDIDVYYEQDKCQGLLQEFEYSKEDVAEQNPTRHKIPINPIRKELYTSYLDGTRDFRTRIQKYVVFREETSMK